jgi:DNA-binding CsgD family transcriptional regulator
MPAAECLCWAEYLWPAGFGGSVGVGSFPPDGRHVGHLTVLTEASSRPPLADRDLIGAVTGVMAHAVDRMRTIRAAAGIWHDAVAGAVPTHGGNALPLPGLPNHRLLTSGSPVLVSPAPDLRGLSHRALQVLGLLVEDWPDERIARALGTTTKDVADSIHHSRFLLAAPSRTGLAVRALREGLFLPRRMSAIS